MRKWRNWQTRKPQEFMAVRPWGFESPLPHQSEFHGGPLKTRKLRLEVSVKNSIEGEELKKAVEFRLKF